MKPIIAVVLAKTFDNHCPQCSHRLNGVTSAEDPGLMPQPKPGDVTICVQCGTVLTWMDDMKLRVFTKEEIAVLGREEKAAINKALEQWRATREGA